HNEPSFEPKELYSMTLRVMQGFYLVRQEVHERAKAHLDMDREANETEQNRMFRAFKADRLLIASSVIACAVKIKLPRRYNEVRKDAFNISTTLGDRYNTMSHVVMFGTAVSA
ncbi:hypothetical protein MTO96_039107, partial [Rhipicephalus appendiculatus]